MNIKAILLTIIFISANIVLAGVSARCLTNSSARFTIHTQKLETKIETYGLFYETTINVRTKVDKYSDYVWNGNYYETRCYDPTVGLYEFSWNFSLNKDSYIKDLQVWSNSLNRFVKVAVMSLSEGEANYNATTSDVPKVLLKQYMRRDYSGSYNIQYDMKISPVHSSESVEFIIKYISPCIASYNKRIVETKSSQFSSYNYNTCYTTESAIYKTLDYNNETNAPEYFTGNGHTWEKQNGFWVCTEGSVSDYKFYFPSESSNGKFLNTFTTPENLKFYQLASKPQITDNIRPLRKIIVAFDLIQNKFREFSRDNFLQVVKEALLVSTLPKDSLVFVTSDFNVNWLNKNFQSSSESFINSKLLAVNQIIPKLNTLPYMLKDIVEYLNSQQIDAEVWIISDDYRTGVRAETVMDIMNETLYKAKNKIKFNIIDAAFSYNNYYIQNKYYSGNEYLYENLTRMSGGNFVRLYNTYYLNFIDSFLDCFAPTVSTVEIDPLLSTGFTHSRINLNAGRNNFNITSRYYQFGLLDGTLPINVNYYGFYLNNKYFKTIEMDEDKTVIPTSLQENSGLYWFGNYLMNDLFLQPQSNSTIKYIEQLSVKENLLTPYSAFVLPGPNGYVGYIRTYEDEIITGVEKPKDVNDFNYTIPQEFSISSFPNPFNPQTTIVINLSTELNGKDKQLTIYDLLGQKIKSFDLSNYSNSSQIKVDWMGTNDFGIEVTSGIYFAVFRCQGYVKSMKLQLLR